MIAPSKTRATTGAFFVAAFLGASLLVAPSVFAGGFEIPDNGTEALGRGGAFTAKADDGTAIQYNVAGLARQRGTQVLVNANLWFSSYSFTRAGKYPDDPSNSLTPWGGTAFPKVSDGAGVFVNPFLAASTDFGLDKWTFALGAFGPSNTGNRIFPASLGYAPNPARYDIVQNKPQVIFATAAAAVSALPWLDLGVALHYVQAKLLVSAVTFSEAVSRGTGAGQCANDEYQPCDSRANIDTSGGGVTASLGAMLHPTKSFSFGANVRGPVTLNTTGDVTNQAPRITPDAGFHPSPVTFVVKLPTVVRVGARYAFLEHDFERADVELDGTYEAWGSAQGDGLHVTIPAIAADNPPPGVNLTGIDFISPHRYHDTWSVRLGGAYNVRVDDMIVTLRAGIYHDASATPSSMTRLDFDTLDKTAGTLGVGLKVGMFQLGLAYAEIFDVSRTVTDGDLRPVNGAQHGASVDPSGAAYPAVNNGTYTGHSRIVSLGGTVHFDGLFRK